jgi:alcohol dehydrogenase
MSDLFAGEAWRLLESHYARVLECPRDIDARGAMLLGAHFAGAAIEASMLGATHACANPLTARYNTTHGIAIAIMLPHVVRWNGETAETRTRYAELLKIAGYDVGNDPAFQLASHLDALAGAAGLPRTLRDAGVDRADIPSLASDAAQQWTGTFNPRPFDESAARQLYERAL